MSEIFADSLIWIILYPLWLFILIGAARFFAVAPLQREKVTSSNTMLKVCWSPSSLFEGVKLMKASLLTAIPPFLNMTVVIRELFLEFALYALPPVTVSVKLPRSMVTAPFI